MSAIHLANKNGMHTGTEFSVSSEAKTDWFEVSISTKGEQSTDDGRFPLKSSTNPAHNPL